jgi:peroxiredoxin
MTPQGKLDAIRTQLLAVLDRTDRQDLEDAIERLRMLQLVEQGLTVGDILPDFRLPDTGGSVVASEDLLAAGPLAVVFFRGPWCPYCSLTLQALEEARPRIEALGGSVVAISPLPAAELRRMADERELRLPLLSDPGSAYAQVCGVRFEMTDSAIALYARLAARFGLTISGLNPASGWELPIPATYVTGRDGVIRFAFGDADWARRAEPEAIVATVAELSQAATATD